MATDQPGTESSVWSRAQITSNTKSGKLVTADIDILTGDGRWVASVEGLRIRRVKKEIFTRGRRGPLEVHAALG